MTAVEIVSGWIAWVVVVGIWLWGMGSFIKWNALMRVYGSDPYEFHGGGYTDLRLKGIVLILESTADLVAILHELL